MKVVSGGVLSRKLGEMFKMSQLRLLLDEKLVVQFDGLSLLVEQVVMRTTVSLDIAVGTFVKVATVPAGERWFLILLDCPETSAAKRNTEVYRAGQQIVFPFVGTARVTGDLWGMQLEEGDYIQVEGNDDINDATRVFGLLYYRLKLNN